jgi:ribosome biogenesis GTPase
LRAQVSGRLLHLAEEPPAVGDWVCVDAREDEGAATITRVLPRRTALVRKEAWRRTRPQVLAANLDWVFVLTSLNRDFNLRRLERFLTLIWEGGAKPAVILTKLDLCAEPDVARTAAEGVAIGVPVHLISAVSGEGIEELDGYLRPGATIALVGASGVGKSTLVNRLFGAEVMVVKEIRDDAYRGRHTTTNRQLIELPRGGMLIDTPGLREIALWCGEDGLESAFDDVETLARDCRFTDCEHKTEPGCAVREAVDPGRLESYHKLRRELEHLERKHDRQARANAKRRWKALTMVTRRWKKTDGRG